MKFLIWFFIYGIPTELIFILRKQGIHLGGLEVFILYGIASAICIVLCKKWDAHSLIRSAKKAGKTRKEYLIENTPKFIIDICNDGHPTSALRDLLKPHVDSKAITPTMANALAEEFGIN